MSEDTSKCSEWFMDVVTSGSGTASGTCDLCKREHFATHFNDACFEDGELDKLRNKAQSEPDKYIEHPNESSLGIGWFYGYQVIWGCPCGWEKMRKYEDFIWEHRGLIIDYLKTRTEAEFEQAKHNRDKVQEIDERKL